MLLIYRPQSLLGWSCSFCCSQKHSRNIWWCSIQPLYSKPLEQPSWLFERNWKRQYFHIDSLIWIQWNVLLLLKYLKSLLPRSLFLLMFVCLLVILLAWIETEEAVFMKLEKRWARGRTHYVWFGSGDI